MTCLELVRYNLLRAYEVYPGTNLWLIFPHPSEEIYFKFAFTFSTQTIGLESSLFLQKKKKKKNYTLFWFISTSLLWFLFTSFFLFLSWRLRNFKLKGIEPSDWKSDILNILFPYVNIIQNKQNRRVTFWGINPLSQVKDLHLTLYLTL